MKLCFAICGWQNSAKPINYIVIGVRIMAITYHDLYLNTCKAMGAMGIEANRLEARELICAASGKSPEKLLQDLNLYTTDEIAATVEQMLQRRANGEPVAYIVGEWSFLGLPFDVGPQVLIPRVDTEVLAQHAINRLTEVEGNIRVLDLCAGSGCVGISIAHRIKTARAVLVDLSDGALDLCKKNIRRHNLTGRVVHLKGDAMQAPSPALGNFDILVSNPPYIPTGDIPGLDDSVKNFEPMMALDGGQDGLDFYRGIVENYTEALKPGGYLCFEFGMGQGDDVCRILTEHGYTILERVKDYHDTERAVIARYDRKEEE